MVIVFLQINFDISFYVRYRSEEISPNVEKPNKCDQCHYASSRAGHLRQHMKTHSGEKSSKCNQCDYASSQAGHLRQHMKTHSGEKSNKCNQCDYASSHASDLRKHLKTHSGEKSNRCNQFQFQFDSSQVGHLKTQKQTNAISVTMHSQTHAN